MKKFYISKDNYIIYIKILTFQLSLMPELNILIFAIAFKNLKIKKSSDIYRRKKETDPWEFEILVHSSNLILILIQAIHEIGKCH